MNEFDTELVVIRSPSLYWLYTMWIIKNNL